MEFIGSRVFTRRLRQLASDSADELLRAIQGELDTRPDRGAMVPGPGGGPEGTNSESGPWERKTRRLPVLIPVLENRRHIHLLILLDKNEQEDASEEQRTQIREWVAQIKKSSGG